MLIVRDRAITLFTGFVRDSARVGPELPKLFTCAERQLPTIPVKQYAHINLVKDETDVHIDRLVVFDGPFNAQKHKTPEWGLLESPRLSFLLLGTVLVGDESTVCVGYS
jgi:hypothetical protein